MKRCPACRRTYDDTQNFCLDDGTSLVSESAASFSSEMPTVNLPYNSNAAPTEALHGVPTAGYQARTSPPPYMMTPLIQKRSPLPWIILGALVLVGAVVGIILATRGSTTTNGGGGTASGLAYSDPNGRFSITLPPGFGAFKSQKQSQPTPAGPIDLNILQSETPQGAAVLGYSDFPEASFVGRTPQKMLEDGRDGALRNIGGKLEKQDNVTVQGHTGLSIYGSTDKGGRSIYVRFQFVLDKPRAYQIGYLAYNRADLDKPEVRAYFDSFRINK